MSERTPIINYEKVRWPLYFILSYAPPITQCYNKEQYKKLECRKYGAESIHSLREAISCYRESTPSFVSEKNWNIKEDKGKSMIHALYMLWLAKRCISGRSGI